MLPPVPSVSLLTGDSGTLPCSLCPEEHWEPQRHLLLFISYIPIICLVKFLSAFLLTGLQSSSSCEEEESWTCHEKQFCWVFSGRRATVWGKVLNRIEDFGEGMRSSHSPSPGVTAAELKVRLLKKREIFFSRRAEWNFAMLCPRTWLILSSSRFKRQSWMKNVPRLINFWDSPVAEDSLNWNFLETGTFQNITKLQNCSE